MEKVLFVATIDEHIDSFHIPYLKWFKEKGFEVHAASNGGTSIPFVDFKFDIPFERSPFSRKNFNAYRELKKVILTHDYSLIHCHTPVGGVLTRLAARGRLGVKVIYTAHGFHFFNGAPWKNWILFYPIEKWLSRFTDCLITINKEDYQLAKGLHTKRTVLVDGVGIDLQKFTPLPLDEKSQLRYRYEFSEDEFILIFVAELNENKHQDFLIQVMKTLIKKYKNMKLLLVGDGSSAQEYKGLVEQNGLLSHVLFLGYRKDIANLLAVSDVAVSSSRREGLPVNLLEAMAVGLPLVATNCRGNRDLIEDGVNGYLVEAEDRANFAMRLEELYHSESLRKTFAKNSLQMIQQYSLEKVQRDVTNLYTDLLGIDDERYPRTNYEVIEKNEGTTSTF